MDNEAENDAPERVHKCVHGVDYMMPPLLAKMYDQLERKQNLIPQTVSVAEMLLLQRDCETEMRRLTAEGQVTRTDVG